MDRDTTLTLAPIFRGISIILIILTFASWALPYFNYHADDLGIDLSRGPMRFVPQNVPDYDQDAATNPNLPYNTYAEWVDLYVYDIASGTYKVELDTVNSLYRRNDTLKTLDGRNEIRDYPDRYSLWEFILMAYNYPQILAMMNYESARPSDAKYHTRFYSSGPVLEHLYGNINRHPFYGDGPEGHTTPRMWRDIRIADMDHEDVNMNPRFIKMWFMAPTLYQILLGAVGLLMCWKKRGILTQFFPLLFGFVGLFGYFMNRVLLYYSFPAVRWVQIILCALVLINAVIGVVIQALEIKSRPEEYYLPMI